MTAQSADFRDTWSQVVDLLVSSHEVPTDAAGSVGPLPVQHKALLRSVHPVGQLNGFVLLATHTQMVHTLVQAELTGPIEWALHQVTGEPQQAVVTLAEEQATQSAAQQLQQPQQAEEDHRHDPRTDDRFGGARADDAHNQGRYHPGQLPNHDQATDGRNPDASSLTGLGRTAAGLGGQAGAHPNDGDADGQHWRTVGFDRPVTEPVPVSGGGGVGKQGLTPPQPPRRPRGPLSDGALPHLADTGPADPMRRPVEEPTLNPKYTFDSFVVGPQNNFAAAAAVAVAESPARAYNPLFISGGSGLGKTHLLHAIGHYATNLYPDLRVRYVSSEEFTNDFINSVRDDAQESFKRRYRDLDILIVDDIQFLEGKEGTQEEFFHTFNALHQADRQIVLSSDRPPRELKTLEERLRTRFEWGLTPDLQLPDLETRVAILAKKADLDRLHVPREVLQFIAEHTSSSIRELEGRLLQVTAQASLQKVPVTLALAEEIIGTDVAEVEITPDIIIAATAEFYGLTVGDLKGPGKTRPVSHARQVAMYLTRSLIDISLPAIGRVFGDRDHSTVLYAHKKIRDAIADKKATRDQGNDLTTRVRERARNRG